MTIRELIADLEAIAKTAGDRLEVLVDATLCDEQGYAYERAEAAIDVRYLGGSTVEIRT